MWRTSWKLGPAVRAASRATYQCRMKVLGLRAAVVGREQKRLRESAPPVARCASTPVPGTVTECDSAVTLLVEMDLGATDCQVRDRRA